MIDFRYLNEWVLLQQNYQPLYIAQELLDSDQLKSLTRQAAKQYLTPLALSAEEMFASFLEFGVRYPLLSIADRSTIAIALHQVLICASDDGLVIETCKMYNVTYTRTLRLLAQMVETGYKTTIEVTTMADTLLTVSFCTTAHLTVNNTFRLNKLLNSIVLIGHSNIT